MTLFYPQRDEHRSHGIATSLSWRTTGALPCAVPVQCRCAVGEVHLKPGELWDVYGLYMDLYGWYDIVWFDTSQWIYCVYMDDMILCDIWFIWIYDVSWCIMMIWWFDDDLMITWWRMSYVDYHGFSHAIAEHRSQRVTYPGACREIFGVQGQAARWQMKNWCWIEASQPQQLSSFSSFSFVKESLQDFWRPLWTTLDHFSFPKFTCLFTWDTQWVSGQQSKLWDLITFGTMPWHLASLGKPWQSFKAVSASFSWVCLKIAGLYP